MTLCSSEGPRIGGSSRLLMCWTIRIMPRAIVLCGRASEAKSKVESGCPSTPTWQKVQRTPSDREKPTIVVRNRSAPILAGSTRAFVIRAGQTNSCRGGAVGVPFAGGCATEGAVSRAAMPAEAAAAAGACASNAPALFVPCHRVLRTDGTLGGFAWGLPVKRALLEREAAG